MPLYHVVSPLLTFIEVTNKPIFIVLSKDGELKVTLFNGTDLFGGEKKRKGWAENLQQ